MNFVTRLSISFYGNNINSDLILVIINRLKNIIFYKLIQVSISIFALQNSYLTLWFDILFFWI